VRKRQGTPQSASRAGRGVRWGGGIEAEQVLHHAGAARAAEGYLLSPALAPGRRAAKEHPVLEPRTTLEPAMRKRLRKKVGSRKSQVRARGGGPIFKRRARPGAVGGVHSRLKAVRSRRIGGMRPFGTQGEPGD